MIGSQAERHLLGAVILDPRQYRFAQGSVSGDDFEDARLGVVFTGIGQMVSTGQPVDQITVAGMFTQWGIQNIPQSEPFEWADSSVLVHAVEEYARSVRADAVRRGLSLVTQVVSERVRSGDQPADVAASAMESLGTLLDGASSGLLQTKTLAEILQGEDTYDWVVPNLLERRDRLVVTGGEGAGKTTFARQLAVLSAAGVHPLEFYRMPPVRVLVVDAENTERQWRRAVRDVVATAQRAGTADPALSVNIVAGHRIDITRGSHLGEIHRLIDVHKPDLLFIGPLYKLVSKAINSDDDAAPLIVALDSLRERDVTLVMEAHAGHAKSMGGDRDLRPRGSSALLGWPEFGFGLRVVEDDPDMVAIVKWRGDRDERSWPKHMRRGRQGEYPWLPCDPPSGLPK